MSKFWGKKIQPKITSGDQRQAQNWLSKKWNSLTTVKGKRNAVMRPELGKMYLTGYSAKYKATLPTYDLQPIMLPFRIENNRLWSLNFHYFKNKERNSIHSGRYYLTTPIKIV